MANLVTCFLLKDCFVKELPGISLLGLHVLSICLSEIVLKRTKEEAFE